eukprot:5423673-Alexandrium_andersonii.AAC.1
MHVAPYSFLCKQCGQPREFAGKPTKLNEGWPKHKCVACGAQYRVGQAKCAVCARTVAQCRCGDTDPPRVANEARG